MDENESVHPAIRGLKTVCRCNNVKYRTIERAIREGAHTITQVAARTTATMGQCGGSCTPEVQKMLDELAPKYAALPKGATAAASARAASNAAAGSADEWWKRK